ncbi:hypothetical protein EVAR_92928_1 [Eumeta japonica]|uniref:Uncharacterized protein n=1 Tax=Eumeta variegata TaxID=151549 RepID=A0A4C1TAE3_EUMVA|nr:hypothetical protein EVAR_92928_1 [Eumeta japonica]
MFLFALLEYSARDCTKVCSIGAQSLALHSLQLNTKYVRELSTQYAEIERILEFDGDDSTVEGLSDDDVEINEHLESCLEELQDSNEGSIGDSSDDDTPLAAVAAHQTSSRRLFIKHQNNFAPYQPRKGHGDLLKEYEELKPLAYPPETPGYVSERDIIEELNYDNSDMEKDDSDGESDLLAC